MVQPDAVGSVIQFFSGDTSDFNVITSVVMDEHVEPSHLAARTFGNVDDAAYVVVQADAVGSVMQLFSGVISVLIAATVLGIVPEPEYVPVQSVAVGSVIQLLIVVTSLLSVVHTDPAHLEARTVGKDAAELYVDVQSVDVGSAMHAFNIVSSTFDIAVPPRDFGIVPEDP